MGRRAFIARESSLLQSRMTVLTEWQVVRDPGGRRAGHGFLTGSDELRANGKWSARRPPNNG